MKQNEFFIVHKKILPDYYEKVIQARELLTSRQCKEVSEAVKVVGISRSTYYKYKDYVFRPSEDENSQKAVISMLLHHQAGTLGRVLNTLSDVGANLITIAQNPPISNRASVVITMDIENMNCSISEVLNRLSLTEGVENPTLVDIA